MDPDPNLTEILSSFSESPREELWWLHNPMYTIEESKGILSSCVNPQFKCGNKCKYSLFSNDGGRWCFSERGVEVVDILKKKPHFRSQYSKDVIGYFLDCTRAVDNRSISKSYFDPKARIHMDWHKGRTLKRSPRGNFEKPINQTEGQVIIVRDGKKTAEKEKSFFVTIKNKEICIITRNRDLYKLFGLLKELKADNLRILFLSCLDHKMNLFSHIIGLENPLEPKFTAMIQDICGYTYRSRKKNLYDYDLYDKTAIKKEIETICIGNFDGSMYARIINNKIVLIHGQRENTLFYYQPAGTYQALSHINFSGDGNYFACVGKVNTKNDHAEKFELIVCDIASSWQLKSYTLKILGRIYNMCLNYNGKKALISMMNNNINNEERTTASYSYLIVDLEKGDISHEMEAVGVAKKMYWRKDDQFVTIYNDYEAPEQWKLDSIDSDEEKFAMNHDDPEQWKLNAEKGKIKLSFEQKFFLYGIFERYCLKKSEKDAIAPLMIGYVHDLIMASLPEKLQVWAKKAINIINL